MNFIKYPKDEQIQPKSFGYWTIKKEDKTNDKLIGKRILLYVSEKDRDYDNVFGLTEDNLLIKLGFAFGETYKELDYKEFSFEEKDINELGEFQLIAIKSPDPNAKIKSKPGCSMILVIALIGGLLVYLFNAL